MEIFEKAYVVLLPVKHETSVFLVGNQLYNYHKPQEGNGKNTINQAFYFFNDEKLEDGDWGYSTITQSINKINNAKIAKGLGYKKIFATTNEKIEIEIKPCMLAPCGADMQYPQPSKSWINMFTEAYNKGKIISEVLVELKSSDLHFFWDNLRIDPIEGCIIIKDNEQKVITNLFKPFNEKGDTTFFGIFEIIYCHFVKKYGCGILSYKIEDIAFKQVKIISFYGDGLLECRLYTNIPVDTFGNLYGILFWESNEYLFGQEPLTSSELKELVFKGNTKKFKKLKKVVKTSIH